MLCKRKYWVSLLYLFWFYWLHHEIAFFKFFLKNHWWHNNFFFCCCWHRNLHCAKEVRIRTHRRHVDQVEDRVRGDCQNAPRGSIPLPQIDRGSNYCGSAESGLLPQQLIVKEIWVMGLQNVKLYQKLCITFFLIKKTWTNVRREQGIGNNGNIGRKGWNLPCFVLCLIEK